MENKNKDKKGFYLTLYAVATVFLLMAFGITILNSSSKDNTEAMQEPVAAVDKSNVKPVTEHTTIASSLSETKESTTEAATKKASSASQAVAENTDNQEASLELFNDDDEMAWPVEGQILMDYSTESAIYDKTLDQYRTNDSICISAPLGSEVCAGADGTVTAITKNNENGVTVSIDHGNGWLSTYSQLQDNLAVSEGQTVYRGDKIGLVAEPTKYSVAMGPHLEFSVFKDDVSTDPKLVLASIE